MPKFDFVISSSIKRSNRVLQMEGIFELPPSQKSEIRWAGDLPLENRPWSVGMINVSWLYIKATLLHLLPCCIGHTQRRQGGANIERSVYRTTRALESVTP